MRHFASIVLILILASACTSYTALQQSVPIQNDQNKEIAEDSTEYELIILDIGFDSWFATRDLKATAHSEWYYSNWNQIYVSEWNRLYMEGHTYIENYIDYNPYEDYGFDVNYKLYNYFQFIEEKNGIKLVTR